MDVTLVAGVPLVVTGVTSSLTQTSLIICNKRPGQSEVDHSRDGVLCPDPPGPLLPADLGRGPHRQGREG